MGLAEFLKDSTDFCDQHHPRHPALWSLLFKHGKLGQQTPLTPDEQALAKAIRGKRQCRRGFCYMNAQQMTASNRDPRVEYAEGLVTVHGFPIPHAWVEINGKIYDPVLRGAKGKKGLADPSREYWGVIVPKRLLVKHWLATGTYSPLTETGWEVWDEIIAARFTVINHRTEGV
jgi:hypothetical protein